MTLNETMDIQEPAVYRITHLKVSGGKCGLQWPESIKSQMLVHSCLSSNGPDVKCEIYF